MFSYCYSNRFLWFRILGYGLKIKDVSIHGLTFSERNKLGGKINQGFQIGKWRISYLSKNGN